LRLQGEVQQDGHRAARTEGLARLAKADLVDRVRRVLRVSPEVDRHGLQGVTVFAGVGGHRRGLAEQSPGVVASSRESS